MAVADGTVGYSTNQLKGFGNLIFIKHENNTISVYAHLKDIHVVKGDKIKKVKRLALLEKQERSKQLNCILRFARKQKVLIHYQC